MHNHYYFSIISHCSFFRFIRPELEKDIKAATIKCYLLALSKFIDYSVLTQKGWYTDNDAARMTKQIQLWNASLAKRMVLDNIEREIGEQGRNILSV